MFKDINGKFGEKIPLTGLWDELKNLDSELFLNKTETDFIMNYIARLISLFYLKIYVKNPTTGIGSYLRTAWGQFIEDLIEESKTSLSNFIFDEES
jgi:hypothetical protein